MSGLDLSPAEVFYLIRHDSFQGAMVESLMNGIYTSIVLFTIHKIASERGIRSLFRPLIILMLLMYTLAIVHLGFRWKYTKEAFVDNGQSQMTVLASLLNEVNTWTVLSTAFRGVIMFIADCIMIWRCWRLYAHSWPVITLPLALLLGELVSLICRIVQKARQDTTLQSSAVIHRYLLAHLSLTLATTVIVTLLIVIRIVRMGGARRYSNIIEIIVESSALYAVTIIIYMPFPLSTKMLDAIPHAALTPMPGIASTLIIARVALGQGIEHTFDEKAISGREAPGRVSGLRFRSTVGGTRDEEESTGVGLTSREDSDQPSSGDTVLSRRRSESSSNEKGQK